MEFSFRLIGAWLPKFIGALVVTLEAAVASGILALCVGSVVAFGMALRNRTLTYCLQVFTAVFRNSPLIVQLFFWFYGLPFIGIKMSSFFTGVLAITLNEGAFFAEIIRGSINGVPKNDWEAAESLGLGRGRILTNVIFPQALRNAIPALTGQISLVIKDTSLLSMIMIVELTRVGSMVYNQYFDLTGFIFAAALYVVLFIGINRASFVLENRSRVRR